MTFFVWKDFCMFLSRHCDICLKQMILHIYCIFCYVTTISNFSFKMKLSLVTVTLIGSIASLASANSILPTAKKSCAGNRYSAAAPTPAFSKDVPTSLIETTLSMRGGAVVEVQSLQEVRDIIAKASAEGKGVIINFGALWCKYYKIGVYSWLIHF